MKEKEKPFVRIPWEEAKHTMADQLRLKYNANGEIKLKQDHGYDGISDFYDEPAYVDIYFN